MEVNAMQPVFPEMSVSPAPVALPIAETLPNTKNATLPIDDIVPNPENPWGGDEADDDGGFTGSIQDLGVLQPIRVRRDEALAKFVIIAGERRWRTAKRVGRTTIDCVIDCQPPNLARSLRECIAENLHRRNSRPIRLAKALQTLQQEAGFSQAQLADAVKKDVSFISRKQSLLRFSATVQAAIDDNRLEESTAIEIAKIDNEQDREALAERVIREDLTREQVLALVSPNIRRRKAAGHSRPLRRLLCQLPGGATIAITCPDEVPELTTEIARDSVEFTMQQLRKAVREKIPVCNLHAHFQNLKAKECKKADVPAARPNGNQSYGSSTTTATTLGE
jgi:ParB family transcriptional regulator, chromosome partitioning protein